MDKSQRLKILDDWASGRRARDSEVDEAFRLQADPEYRAKERQAEERKAREQRAREDAGREKRKVQEHRILGLLGFGGLSVWALFDLVAHRYGPVAFLVWAALAVFACTAAWKGPAVKKDGPQFWWQALEIMLTLLVLGAFALGNDF